MTRLSGSLFISLVVAIVCGLPSSSGASPADAMKSVVSVRPVWSSESQATARAHSAPEGSGIILEPGIVVTAWHVVKPARRIAIRLADGHILPAQLVAGDAATDIAVIEIEVDAELEPIEIAPSAELAQPVCAIANAYGLGLSLTCGVVSALRVTNAGFNEIEDFVQTDAAANPGSSGGALVDEQGRLVGMLSAIFASESDSNIGINFAVSSELLQRVVEDLMDDGAVRLPSPGWRLASADGARLMGVAAPVVIGIDASGPAAAAGIEPGDLILQIGSRRTQTSRDAQSALAVISDLDPPVEVTILREDREQHLLLRLEEQPSEPKQAAAMPLADCPHPQPVCLIRQAVFPVSSHDPAASATRIGTELLVTNRHVVGERTDAIVHTPDGPRPAQVVPSAYAGDLVLLEVVGLPATGLILDPKERPLDTDAMFFAVGADIARREIRVFEPGSLIAGPDETAEMGRIHVRSQMQPGVSGGALVDDSGLLAGIAVGGGDDRFEAIPIEDVVELLDLRGDESALEVTRRLGTAFSACVGLMESFREAPASDRQSDDFRDTCLSARNPGQLLETGRLMAEAGKFDHAIALLREAAALVPNSINARISLLVSLQLAGRFDEMTGHARWLAGMAPDDPGALRFAIQSGVWGGDPELAEEAYGLLSEVDPRQAAAARRFIDNPPPAPARR